MRPTMVMLATPIVMMGARAWADENGAAQAGRVTVCMSGVDEVQVANAARMMATKMFAGIGVGIEWRANRYCPLSPDVIKVSLSRQTPETQLPGALAHTLFYEGTHIVVFYDRVKSWAQDDSAPQLLTCVLAHVLVHEITHILPGVRWHSAAGIMKAQWDNRDLAGMKQKPLGFTGDDVLLIYHGLEARQARQAGSTLIGAR